MTDQPATECVICGGYISAGTEPPVCSESCDFELETNCEFAKFAREERKKHENPPVQSVSNL